MKAKYNATMLDVFREVFNWLPLAFVINSKVGGGSAGSETGLGAIVPDPTDGPRGFQRCRATHLGCFCAQPDHLPLRPRTHQQLDTPQPPPTPDPLPPPSSPPPPPQVLVVHGGLFSKDDVTLDDLRKVHRNQ